MTSVGFVAGVLKIKIQPGRSLTRRRELRRPSTRCWGKKNAMQKKMHCKKNCRQMVGGRWSAGLCWMPPSPQTTTPMQTKTVFCEGQILLLLTEKPCLANFFPQHIVEGLLNSRRRVSDRPSWILIFKTPARKSTNVVIVVVFFFYSPSKKV